MRDEDKTKQQLISELHDVRQQLSSTEDETVSADADRDQRSARRPTQTPIAFVANFELVHAQGVDVSESGICFETSEDLQFEMEFEVDGVSHQPTAHLVWMRKTATDRSRWGLKSASTETSGLLSIHKLLDVPEIELPEA